MDEGGALLQRAMLNFTGPGVVATDDPVNLRTDVTITGGGHTIANDSGTLPARATLVFIGAGVTVTDDAANNRTVVRITGGPEPPEPPAGDTYLTRTGWTAAASSQFSGSFVPGNAIDNNDTTCWHSANGAGTGAILTIDMQTEQYFDFVDFVPRQEARTDPRYIQMEVSTDNSSWAVSSTAWFAASDITTKRIGASILHHCRYVRLVFVANYDTSNVACAELMPGMAANPVYDIAPHNMTSNTGPSPVVISASSFFVSVGDGTGAWNAFNGIKSAAGAGYWLGTGGGTDWLKIGFGSGISRTLKSYAISVNTIPEPNRAPKNWTLEGSNDDSAWTVLDTVANETAWGSGDRRIFTCDVMTGAYRYFRLNITANNGDVTYTQVGELELFAQRSDL